MTWGKELAERFAVGRWHGEWIWAPGPVGTGRTVVALRRDIEVERVEPVVPGRVAAVGRYVLFVNETEVARGPMRASRRRQSYDLVDLAPHLTAGTNRISAVAWIYANATPWWLPPHPGAQGAFAFEAIVGDELVVTDATWSARTLVGWDLTPAQGIQGRGREVIDATSLAADWQPAVLRPSAVPGEWGQTHPPTHLAGPFVARAVSWPSTTTRRLRARGSDAWTADEVVVGTVRVDVVGPAGSTVVLNVSERLDARGAPRPSKDDSSFEVRCDGTRRTIESLDAYGLSGIEVRSDIEAVVHGIEVAERLHPVTGDASFACSDGRLDRIWSVGRRTVSLCSWDAYLDCPTREQRAWVGDAVVHQMVDLTTNDDWTLARWYPRMSASPRTDGMLPMAVAGDIEHNDLVAIPDWALHWVHAAWNLYRYVGDREEIASLLPTVEGVMRWFARSCGADGLPTAVPGAVLIDWASVYVEDASSAVCGLWGRALRQYEEMARWLGDRSRARWARHKHRSLARGFERLWDPKQRRYADVIAGGELRPMASQHGQAAAIVGGLVPRRRLDRLVEVMTDERHLVHAAFSAPNGPALPNSDVEVGGSFVRDGRPDPWWDVDREIVRAQPFFRYIVHDALVSAGRADLIASQCLDWTVALDRCATSWTETWYGGTICHGWSSTPTRDLTTQVLGIRPAEPGFTVAVVDPQLGPLEWARGSAPTPFGTISVEADRRRVNIDSPVPVLCRGTRYKPGSHVIG